MQDAKLVGEFVAALAEAENLRMSKSYLFRAGVLPVAASTLYRWLNGDVDPGASRLENTIKALKEFTARERARQFCGAKTLGGPYELDAEHSTVTRGGRIVVLKGQEFKILETLKGRTRPAYRDWICDVSSLPLDSFGRALSELRKKLDRIDIDVRSSPPRGGEPVAYFLFDRAAKVATDSEAA